MSFNNIAEQYELIPFFSSMNEEENEEENDDEEKSSESVLDGEHDLTDQDHSDNNSSDEYDFHSNEPIIVSTPHRTRSFRPHRSSSPRRNQLSRSSGKEGEEVSPTPEGDGGILVRIPNPELKPSSLLRGSISRIVRSQSVQGVKPKSTTNATAISASTPSITVAKSTPVRISSYQKVKESIAEPRSLREKSSEQLLASARVSIEDIPLLTTDSNSQIIFSNEDLILPPSNPIEMVDVRIE